MAAFQPRTGEPYVGGSANRRTFLSRTPYRAQHSLNQRETAKGRGKGSSTTFGYTVPYGTVTRGRSYPLHRQPSSWSEGLDAGRAEKHARHTAAPSLTSSRALLRCRAPLPQRRSGQPMLHVSKFAHSIKTGLRQARVHQVAAGYGDDHAGRRE